MWVKFTKQFRFKATPQALIRYPDGAKMNIPTKAAEAAIAAGAAVKIQKSKSEAQAVTSEGQEPEQPAKEA